MNPFTSKHSIAAGSPLHLGGSAKNMLNEETSNVVRDASKSTSDFASKIGQSKPDFGTGASDLKVTDRIKKKYDGYDHSNRTLVGKTGTNTTSSGKTLFPDYSSKSVGTYKKNNVEFNKIRPGLEARSSKGYADLEKEVNKRKINLGIDPVKLHEMNAGQSRRPGTFKQYLNTGSDEKGTLNLQSNRFEGKRARNAQKRMDNRLNIKSWDLL
jgi:hypothetical protein